MKGKHPSFKLTLFDINLKMEEFNGFSIFSSLYHFKKRGVSLVVVRICYYWRICVTVGMDKPLARLIVVCRLDLDKDQLRSGVVLLVLNPWSLTPKTNILPTEVQICLTWLTPGQMPSVYIILVSKTILILSNIVLH